VTLFNFTNPRFQEWLYRQFKSLAFLLNPELAHEISIHAFAWCPWSARIFGAPVDSRKYALTVGHKLWPFPVGLAAGLDKNAQAMDFFSRLPFGAVEVGTVTPLAQPGNPSPRLWRYVSEESLRNQMGFNNQGATRLAARIMAFKKKNALIGINLGKNKNTPQEKAAEDYRKLYDLFAPISDYLVINVSSPNTPNLRALQKAEELSLIFDALEDSRKKYPADLYLKISPDLDANAMESIISLAMERKLQGLMATNTTILPERGEGGCSGKILKTRASEVRQFILDRTAGTSLELIGVGGIDSFEDLWEFWQGGGKAVQIYTSFIYHGPPLLYQMAREIDRILAKNQIANLGDLLKNIKKVVR
jgi:dihydroorotate dehydrogenase